MPPSSRGRASRRRQTSAQTSPQQASAYADLTVAQLFERACASLDVGSRLLEEGSAGLSPSYFAVGENVLVKSRAHASTRKPQRRTRSKSSTCTSVQPTPESALSHASRPALKKKANTAPTISPFFANPVSSKPTKGPTKSPFFSEPFSRTPAPLGLNFELEPAEFGLIQERICRSLFALVVQAILWNKTRGTAARPILWDLLCRYPTPDALAKASETEVEKVIATLGLQRTRAKRLVDMAKKWVDSPPCPERRYGRRNYPKRGSNPHVKEGEILGLDDEREGWEIGHLPGVGEYALDSYRIFGRDRLRGLNDDSPEDPEWKRVVPRDKELAPYCRWKWAQEGWDFDIETGIRVRIKP